MADIMYECRFINEDIEIGVGLGEKLRQIAAPVEFFVPVTHEKPISKTEAGLLWNEKYIYAFFRAYDKDIFAYHTERDSHTCDDDVLEFFFKTDPDKEPYYNFEINALNTIFDAYTIRRGAGKGHRWKRWNCEGLKSAVSIKGTINDPSDVDDYWELEMAIPFASLEPGNKKSPKPGDEWLFNLSRYDYSVYQPDGVELSASSRLTEVNFHKNSDWNRLAFTK